MGLRIEQAHFNGRAEALAEVEKLGLIARDGAMAAGDLEDVHWHEYTVRIFVLEGGFETKEGPTGELLAAGPGDLIVIPARTPHAARCPEPARYIAAFESAEALANFRPMPLDAL
jgi:quercetin dioxygenase-like cupin family protein